MSNDVTRTIRVYKVIDPALLGRYVDELAKLLFGLKSADEPRGLLGISPRSGFLFFCNNDEIWQNGRPSVKLPRDANSAETAARKFLREANQRVAQNSLLQRERLPPLFPDSIRHIASKPVMQPDTGKTDHWLSSFGVDLTIDIVGQIAPVLGAAIEVRTGAEGKVIGISSRWRPLTSSDTTRFLALPGQVLDPIPSAGDVMRGALIEAIEPPVTPTKPTVRNQAQGEQARTQLLYLLQDQNALQTVVAPYHALLSDHDGWFYPATTYSLLANIIQTPTPTGTRLQALVRGGSERYVYKWASWSPEVFRDGSLDLGTSMEAEVPAGVHNVVLQVLDQLTGATTQTEAMVYARSLDDQRTLTGA